MRGNQVPLPVKTRLPAGRIQFLQPVADRHVRTDHEYDIREPGVPAAVHLVEDAPGGEHPHDRGLSRRGGHLAGGPAERRVPFGLPVIARFVRWDVDPLAKVGAGLGEEDDRLGRLYLGEEEPVFATLPAPVVEQFEGSSSDPRITLPAPLLDPLPDQVHEGQRDPLAANVVGSLGHRHPGVSVEISRVPSSQAPLRIASLLDEPVFFGFPEGGIENRLRDFEAAHRFASRRLFTTTSSFPRSSMTLTATCPFSPASKGALFVPARWSHTDSSYVPLRAFFRLSQAPVRGKNAWLTLNQRPL